MLLLIILSRRLGYCLEKENTVVIVFAVFLSWCAGFLAQSFGEFIGIRRDYPKGKKDGQYVNDRQWYDFYVKYQDEVKDNVKNAELVERFIVIKEMCGNMASVLLLCGIVVLVFECNALKGNWRYALIYLLFIFLFFRMHRKHVRRQAEYMKRVVDKKQST